MNAEVAVRTPASPPVSPSTESKPEKRAYPAPAPALIPRQFECTRLITAEAAKDAIPRIPSFARQQMPATILPHARVERV
jgi:hypothetical protein